MTNLDAIMIVIDKFLSKYDVGEYDYYAMIGFKESFKNHYYPQYFPNLSYQEVNSRLSKLELKSPFIGLFLSLLCGYLGVGRFYAGQYKYGTVKLSMFLLAAISLFLQMSLFRDNTESILFYVFGTAMYATAISYLIDIFLIRKSIIKQNTRWIENTILFNSKKSPAKNNKTVGQACN